MVFNNIDDMREFMQYCNIAQSKLNLDNKIKFFKTHNAFWRTGKYSFTDDKNTMGIIHIVRDPRNVITQLKTTIIMKIMKRPLSLWKMKKILLA